MYNVLLNIVTFGLKPLYEKHLSYYIIVKEFREKLPRPQNKAKEVKSPLPFIALNLSTHKTSISEADIDKFYNKLNQFDYSFIICRKHYEDYTRNLNRFNPKAENKNFDLVIVQEIIDSPYPPLKPFDVLLFCLKSPINRLRNKLNTVVSWRRK